MTSTRTWTRSWPFLVMYVLVSVPFFLRSWHSGYDPTDDGLILGFSWRIWNGQIPHRDFLFTRPPLTPMIHSLWFMWPAQVPILGARAAYFAQMILSGLIPAMWAFSSGHLRRSVQTMGVLAISFVLALHFFPPMPWYTVDGVDLSVLGLAAAVTSLDSRQPMRWRMLWCAIAGALFTAAAFTKQNFAAMDVFLVGLLGLTWIRERAEHRSPWRSALPMLGAGAGIVVVLAAMTGYLWSHGALTDFLAQIQAGSDAGELRKAGWALYSHHLRVFPLSPVLGFGFGYGGLRIGRGRMRETRWRLLCLACPFVFLTILALTYLLNHAQFMAFQLFWFGLGLCVSCCLEAWIRPRRAAWDWAAFACGTLAIAWLSSISRGWNTPLLGMAGFGTLLARPMERTAYHVPALWRTMMASLAAVFVLGVGVYRYCQAPYHDPAVSTRYDLASLYPGFSRMYATRETYERHSELKELSAWASTEFKNPLLVFPDFPLFYFLENRMNPASLDWWWPPDYRGFETRLMTELTVRKPVILFERRSPRADDCSPKYGRDILTAWIEQNSIVVRRSNRFCVLVLR